MSVEHFVQSETVQYQQIINNEMKSVYQILPRCCKLNCHNVQPEAQSNGHWCACTITLLLFSPFSFSYSSMHLMLCFLAIRLELNVSSAINETTWTKVHFMIVGVQCTWFRDWTPFNLLVGFCWISVLFLFWNSCSFQSYQISWCRTRVEIRS